MINPAAFARFSARKLLPVLLMQLGLLIFLSFPFFANAQETGAFNQAASQRLSAEALQAVPDPLKPWVDWSLRDAPLHLCEDSQIGSLCSWYSQAQAQLDGRGLSFQFQVEQRREAMVPLPGGADWPTAVQVNGQAASVLDRNGVPMLLLKPGAHRVEGRIDWQQRPPEIAFPPAMGVISLKGLGGQARGYDLSSGVLVFENRAKAKQTVGTNSSEPRVNNQASLKVQRLLVDGHPFRLVTRFVVSVSGAPRDLFLAGASLEGFKVVGIKAELPSFLSDQGVVRVKAVPGRHTIDVLSTKAQAVTDLASLALPTVNKEQDGDAEPAFLTSDLELWAFQPAPWLRRVRVAGARSIDPTQTNLPQSWKSLQAYAIDGSEGLKLEVLSRGEEAPKPDNLSLRRTLWYDFAGNSWTALDRVTGTINRSNRMEANAALSLGAVRIDDQPQLVSVLGEGATQTGVGVNRGPLRLNAESRIETGLSDVPTVGWQTKMQSVDTTLLMPPGWTVLHVLGAEQVTNAWLTKWRLLDLFIILLAAGAITKWIGIVPGILSLLALVLVHFELPWLALSFVVLVLLDACRRLFLPETGFLAFVFRWGQRALWSIIAIWVALFAVGDVRKAIYPQTNFFTASADTQRNSRGPTVAAGLALEENVAFDMRVEQESAIAAPSPKAVSRSFSKAAPQVKRRPYGKSFYQNVVGQANQTGQGLASWSVGNQVGLRWSGPVTADQNFSIWALSPFQTLLVTLVKFALLLLAVAILGWVSFSAKTKGLWSQVASFFKGKKPKAAALVLPFLVLGLSTGLTAPITAQSQAFPEQFLLDQLSQHLKADLSKQPACAPQCGQIDTVRVRRFAGTLRIDLGFSAATQTAIALPRLSDWAPARLRLQPAKGDWQDLKLFGFRDGQRFALAPAGKGRIRLEGPFDPRQPLSLVASTRIKHWDVQVQGMVAASGKNAMDGRLLTLQPEAPDPEVPASTETKPEETDLPFGGNVALAQDFRAQRHLSAGVTWDLQTQVTRLAGLDRASSVTLNLLEKERPLNDDLDINQGRVSLNFATNQAVAAWQSILDPVETLVLKAPETGPSEVWSVQATNLWHLKAEGLPRSLAPVGVPLLEGNSFTQQQAITRPDLSVQTFYPWPGEELVLRFQRPLAAAGATSNIDRSQSRFTLGRNLTRADVRFRMTSSLGGRHKVILPEGAIDPSVTIDGQAQPLVTEKEGERESLVLSFGPGQHEVALGYEQPYQTSGVFDFARTTPSMDLNSLSLNNVLRLEVPRDRWLLWAQLKGAEGQSAPQAIGPAILFWGFVPVALVFAILLAWIAPVPIRTLGWFLLLAGLSQVNVGASIAVVVFLVAMAFVPKAWPNNEGAAYWPYLYNLRQVGIFFWTLAVVLALVVAIRSGLLSSPDMKVAGFESFGRQLAWYIDRSPNELPAVQLFTAPIWLYRGFMLLWALWLAFTLLRLAPWLVGQVSHAGWWQQMQLPERSKRSAGVQSKASKTESQDPE